MPTNEQRAIKTTYKNLAGNTVLAAVKWLTGFFGNFYAIIADTIVPTTDMFSSMPVLAGLKYSTRPPDKNHAYGHGRADPFITFLVLIFLIVSAFIITQL